MIEDGACGVCGGPRIEGNLGGEAAIEALKEQKKHLGLARMASISTVLQGMFATAAAFAMLVVHPESILAKAIFFFLAAMPLVLSFRSRLKAKKERGLAREAGDRALQAAAEEAAGSGKTAKEVAKTLKIEPAHAEKLLSAGMVDSRVRIDVHDESAEVVYRSDEPEARDEEFASHGDDETASAHERRR